jgi:MFS family permease
MEKILPANEVWRLSTLKSVGDDIRGTITELGNSARLALSSKLADQPGHPKAPLYTTLIAVVAALGGLLFGFDTGVIAGAMLFVVPDFNLGPAQQGLVVSAVTFGALFGARAGGTSADTLGRRLTNIIAGMSFIAGSVVSPTAPNVDVLIASRIIIGLAIGLTSVAAPMYIAELSPARNRGKLVSLFQLAITAGILVSYLFDRALAPDQAWRWMLGLAGIPGALLVLGMITIPESPRWLLKAGSEKRRERRFRWCGLRRKSRRKFKKSTKISSTISWPSGWNCLCPGCVRHSWPASGSPFSNR